MSRDFEAIFVQGHLIPQGPVDLQEHERVRVRIEPLSDAPQTATTPDFSGMSLHEALEATGLLGCLRGLPVDLSTNPIHMEGFGEHQDGAH